jgi:predicted O-linked N-acetylglucosamine transferase (SPINDLY family)
MDMPKTYNQLIKIEQPDAASLKATAFKAESSRKKGWFQKVFVGYVSQTSRAGAIAFVARLLKRVGFGNWYSEKVGRVSV